MNKQKICIIGNGLTGLTAALILGKLNLDVHLIAAPDKKRSHIEFDTSDDRVVFLTQMAMTVVSLCLVELPESGIKTIS